jgi:hypothetical protein
MRTRSHWIAVLAIGFSLLIATPAHAEVKTISATVLTEGSEPFSSLRQKAADLAQESVNKAFQDPRVTEVRVTVSGGRNGAIAPVISARITRAQWQESTQVSAWARSFERSEDLLGFNLPVLPPPVAAQPVDPAVAQSTNQASSPGSINQAPAAPAVRRINPRPRGRSYRDRLREDSAYRDD